MDRRIEKKYWSKKRLLLVALCLCLCLFLVSLIIKATSESEYRTKKSNLVIKEVTSGKFYDFIPLQGVVKPKNVTFLSITQSGRVENIFVSNGDYVARGNQIIELSNIQLKLDLIGKEAQVGEQLNELKITNLTYNQAKIDDERLLLELDYSLKNIISEFERNQKLYKKGHISDKAYEVVNNNVEYYKKLRKITIRSQKEQRKLQKERLSALENSVHRLESNLQFIRDSVKNLIIYAPISGVLTDFNVDIGESKISGDKIGEIHKEESYFIRSEIDQYYLDRVTEGQLATFSLSGSEYGLKLEKVYPTVENGRFSVDFAIDRKGSKNLRSGQTLQVRLKFSEDTTNLLLIPNNYFYTDTAGEWVYLLDKKETFAVKKVTQLGRRNSEFIEVVSGLSEGDKIIASSYEDFLNAEKIIIN